MTGNQKAPPADPRRPGLSKSPRPEGIERQDLGRLSRAGPHNPPNHIVSRPLSSNTEADAHASNNKQAESIKPVDSDDDPSDSESDEQTSDDGLESFPVRESGHYRQASILHDTTHIETQYDLRNRVDELETRDRDRRLQINELETKLSILNNTVQNQENFQAQTRSDDVDQMEKLERDMLGVKQTIENYEKLQPQARINEVGQAKQLRFNYLIRAITLRTESRQTLERYHEELAGLDDLCKRPSDQPIAKKGKSTQVNAPPRPITSSRSVGRLSQQINAISDGDGDEETQFSPNMDRYFESIAPIPTWPQRRKPPTKSKEIASLGEGTHNESLRNLIRGFHDAASNPGERFLRQRRLPAPPPSNKVALSAYSKTSEASKASTKTATGGKGESQPGQALPKTSDRSFRGLPPGLEGLQLPPGYPPPKMFPPAKRHTNVAPSVSSTAEPSTVKPSELSTEQQLIASNLGSSLSQYTGTSKIRPGPLGWSGDLQAARQVGKPIKLPPGAPQWLKAAVEKFLARDDDGLENLNKFEQSWGKKRKVHVGEEDEREAEEDEEIARSEPSRSIKRTKRDA